jgi:hypothetical protein
MVTEITEEIRDNNIDKSKMTEIKQNLFYFTKYTLKDKIKILTFGKIDCKTHLLKQTNL